LQPFSNLCTRRSFGLAISYLEEEQEERNEFRISGFWFRVLGLGLYHL